MSIENKIIEALQKNCPELIQDEEYGLDMIQENTYRLNSCPAYFIKYIAENDSLGKNELRVNQTILRDSFVPAPSLRFVINAGDAMIAGWEWLDGTDLRHQHRNLLPQVFEHLGHFHAQQRHTHPVQSLVTRQSFETIKDLLDAEIRVLTKLHGAAVRQQITDAFAVFQTGFATCIHGDMHPGNIRLTGQGLKFVDWGYSTSSLSLFDLGYIQTIQFDEAEEGDNWWIITPEEAQLVLPAYYHACGLGGQDYHQIHRAVMLWHMLWSHHNCIIHGDQAAAKKCNQRIHQLLALQ